MENSPVLPLRLSSKKSTAETISQLARRHLTDQMHTTSDEELLYAKVELSGMYDTDDDNFFGVNNAKTLNPFPTEEPEYTNGTKDPANHSTSGSRNMYS